VGPLALLGPPRHGARLRREADGSGLLWPLRAGVGDMTRDGVVVPVRPRMGLVARLGLLTQRQQLLHRLGTGGACAVAIILLRMRKR
jgi:hypothetical protein